MQALIGFYDEVQKAISRSLSWANIRDHTSDIQYSLRSMKFQLPDDEQEGIYRSYKVLLQEMSDKFASLADG